MTDDNLAELLLQWEELYEQGQDVAPEALARDYPHLIPALARRIHALKVTSWLKKSHDDGEGGEQSSTTPSDPAGRILAGRYRLDERIGEGGFAQVWKGFDLELRRVVAIKMPKQGRLPSAERVEHFLAEARRIARLKHPGVVQVHDVGRENDTCFIVEDFVEGGSLGQRLAQKRPTIDEAVRWIAQVAETLAFAHQEGFVHRDVKPANILIDRHGRALLADFGIAASMHKPEEVTTSCGTLPYMSPEMVQGQQFDPRTDIYALGVVFFELLTGTRPFEATSPAQLREQIVANLPRSVRSLEPTIPAALDQICTRCLARQPADRYPTAGALVQELHAFLDQQNRPAGGRSTFLLLAGALLVVLVGLGWKALTIGSVPAGATPQTALVVEPDQRGTAAAILQRGGKIQIEGRAGIIRFLAELPPEPIRLQTAEFGQGQRVDAALLQEISQVSTLTDLNLTGTVLTDDALAPLEKMVHLKTLRLNRTGVTDAALRHLAGCKALTVLEVGRGRITDSGLATVSQLPQLVNLNLTGVPITDDGLIHLRQLPALRQLWLNETRITDAGVAHLTGLKLDLLELRQTGVTDAVMKHMGRLPDLTWLDISSTQVGNAGLLQWEKPLGLRRLYLNNLKQLSDDGVGCLVDLKLLQRLEIQGTGVSAAGVALLRRALPGCEVKSQ